MVFTPTDKTALIQGLDEYFGSNDYTTANIVPEQVTAKDEINTWDVSGVKDMSELFYSDSKRRFFNQDISNWDVSNVTNFKEMFRNSQFNQDISKWDVSNGATFNQMFSDSNINQPNLKYWSINTTSSQEYRPLGSMFDSMFQRYSHPDFHHSYTWSPEREPENIFFNRFITLEGNNHLTIKNGDTWQDPGATAGDGSPVTITGTVDTSVDGTYTIMYSATYFNIPKTKTRTVVVFTTVTLSIPEEITVVTVASNATVNLLDYTTLTKNGVEQTDKDDIVYGTLNSERTVVFFIADSRGDGWINDNDSNYIEILDSNGIRVEIIATSHNSGKNWHPFEIVLQEDYQIFFTDGARLQENRMFIVDVADKDAYIENYITWDDFPPDDDSKVLFKSSNMHNVQLLNPDYTRWISSNNTLPTMVNNDYSAAAVREGFPYKIPSQYIPNTQNGDVTGTTVPTQYQTKKLAGNTFSASELISMGRQLISSPSQFVVTETVTVEATYEEYVAQTIITISDEPVEPEPEPESEPEPEPETIDIDIDPTIGSGEGQQTLVTTAISVTTQEDTPITINLATGLNN